MIPFFVFSILLVTRLVANERAAAERSIHRASSELATALDREIETTFRVLGSIASSPNLAARDLQAFHGEIRAILATQPNWSSILLHAPDGDFVLSALRPFGEKLERPIDSESLERVFASGAPVVGSLVRPGPRSKLAGRFAFAARVPVLENGVVVFALSAIILADSLQRTVANPVVSGSDEWTRSVADDRGVIVARSRSPESFVGQPAPREFFDLATGQDAGHARWRARDGEPAYVSFRRAPLTRWLAVVAVPIAVLEAPARKALLTLSAAGVALLIVSGSVAFAYSRRLAQRIRSVAASAVALATGVRTRLEPSSVAEIDQLGNALSTTAELLSERQREREQTLAALEKALRVRDEFITIAGHELRTPITAMKLQIEIIERRLQRSGLESLSPDKLARALESSNRQLDRLTRLVNAMLDLSLIATGSVEVERVELDLSELVRDAIQLEDDSCRANGCELRAHIEPGIVGHFDRSRMAQVVSNLLGNAIKYGAGKPIAVDLRRKDAVTVELKVRDQGIGISDRDRERIFGKFERAVPAANISGFGIGLYIVRRIVEAHHGTIHVDSEIGRGSTFTILLPLVSQRPDG